MLDVVLVHKGLEDEDIEVPRHGTVVRSERSQGELPVRVRLCDRTVFVVLRLKDNSGLFDRLAVMQHGADHANRFRPAVVDLPAPP